MPIQRRRSAPEIEPLAAAVRQVQQVPAVVRALAILEHLGQQREPISLARLTQELSLPKSSIRAICNTLVSCDYVRRHADGGYRLGPKLVGLAELFLSGTDVVGEFAAIWADQKTSPEETVLLSVLTGTEVVYLAVRNGARPLGVAFRVGFKFPARLTASGKAMLAYLDPGEVQRLINEDVTVPPGSKSRALKLLLEELEATRLRGHSIDAQGVREGIYAFGAPVFDAADTVVAAVSVCFSTASWSDKAAARHRDVAIDLARALTERLGGHVPRVRREPALRHA
jgi:DNA-binding IclR family transcriptional regulator